MLKIIIIIISLNLFLLPLNVVQAWGWDYTPEDTNMVYQTYFDKINIEPSWSNGLEVNKEVVVAVLDSGIDIDHPDLIDNIWNNIGEIPNDGIDNDNNSYVDDINGWNFMDSNNNLDPDITGDYDYTAVNHGTVIAGVISATANNNGIIGIAPNAKIMPLKILDNKGIGNTLVLSQAIDYAVENGADIINLSIVGTFFDDNLRDSITNAYNSGVMIIAASGNEDNLGVNLDDTPHYPVCDTGDINRVLGVAAVDSDNKLASFSNYGKKCIDISAPGTHFYSTTLYSSSNSKFKSYYKGGWSGTSVATPIISATAALIKMQYPDFRPYDIYNILMSSTQSLEDSNPVHHINLGSGLIDIGNALNTAEDYYNQNIKIILSPDAGLSPEILIMDSEANLESSFLAYAEKFHGGVNIAVGDVNNDGEEEIITAPMKGGGPHIRVFDQYGKLLSEFFAYDASFHGGVNIAVGDVNNDGEENIITAPMSGNVPEIRVFDNRHRIKGRFLAYDSSMTSGVEVTVGDINNDKWNEIITVPVKDDGYTIKLFSMKGRNKGQFLSYSKSLTMGLKIIAKDISGDNIPEILTLPNKGTASLLRVYDHDGLEKSNMYLRNPNDKNGYSINILR